MDHIFFLLTGKPDVIGPSNATAVTGTTTELHCAVTSSLAYTTQWYHNDILLSNTSRTITQVDMLMVAIIRDTDTGSYHCVATNAAGSTVSSKGWLTVCGKLDNVLHHSYHVSFRLSGAF